MSDRQTVRFSTVRLTMRTLKSIYELGYTEFYSDILTLILDSRTRRRYIEHYLTARRFLRRISK